MSHDTPTRSPYNQMVRDNGDKLAKIVLNRLRTTYTSPGGKSLFFIPDCTDPAQALAVHEEILRSGLWSEQGRDLGKLRHIVIAAAKAITRITEGASRARVITLDERFEAWSLSRPEFEHDFPGAIMAYCEETGRRIEMRENSSGPELGLRGEVVNFPGGAAHKRVHPASVAAYREAFATAIAAYGTASAQQKAESLTESAVAEWTAKQEGR